jgi:hypothetical protein
LKGGGKNLEADFGGDEKDVREESLRGIFLHILKKKGFVNSPRLERTRRKVNSQSKMSLTGITDSDAGKMLMDALATRNDDRGHGSV